MGFAGYVAVCVQFYCVGSHCLSLHVSAYMAIFKCLGALLCWFLLSFTTCFALHGIWNHNILSVKDIMIPNCALNILDRKDIMIPNCTLNILDRKDIMIPIVLLISLTERILWFQIVLLISL
jgi:hypothetical protein